MEVIRVIQEKLQSKNFSFEQPNQWQNITYMCGDYYYHRTNKVIAKYIFIHINEISWHTIRSEDSDFITDVIEDMYYSLSNDLRWNLYLVCVATDEVFAHIDRYEKRHFENNIKYTRNYIISESMIEQRIPVGKVLMDAKQFGIQYPIEEWQTQLGEYSFCMETFSEDSFLNNVLTKRLFKHSSIDEKSENIDMQELCKILMPKVFRPHLYQNDWELPCRKFNLLFGANGTGKTSVLSAIELSITGTIYKLKKYPNDSVEQANVVLTFSKQGKEITLEKPCQDSQVRAREREWYNSHGNDSTVFKLNSLFHRFNYFSVDETSQFTSFPPAMEDILSRLLYGNDTLKIWNNIQIHRHECARIVQKLRNEYETINIQMQQPPPSVDKIYEYYIWDYINEYGLQIPSGTSFQEIQKIVLKMQSGLEKLSKYKPIFKKATAESRLQEINQKLSRIHKHDIVLERKIKKLKAVENNSTLLSKNRDKEDRLFTLKTEQEKLKKNKSNLLREQEKLQKTIEFWETLSPWIGNNPDLTGDELKKHCKKIYKAITEFFQFQNYLNKLEQLKKRQEQISLQLISCKRLAAKLKKLHPPEKYTETFIRRNILQISQIFINLHTPQEFSELRIINGEVVGVRNEEIVPLTNMSTGQRTALIFSVFFNCIYLILQHHDFC